MLRFNTESDGNQLCWRLVLDGEEVLVDSVEVECPVETTKDWIAEKGVWKHHITCRPDRVHLVECDGKVHATLV